MKYVLIACGGALGSVLRYWLQGAVQRITSGTFPTGTLAVNVVGCLVIGFLHGLYTGPWLIREEYRVGLTVGVLGGFTTFSALGLESFSLLNAGQGTLALLNLASSCGLGVAAVWLGYRLAIAWFGV